MKEKEISVYWGETVDIPGTYGNFKPSVSLTGILEEHDTPEGAHETLMNKCYQLYCKQLGYMARAAQGRDQALGKEVLPYVKLLAEQF